MLYEKWIELPCFVLGIDYIDGSHTEEDKGWQKIKKAYQDGTF